MAGLIVFAAFVVGVLVFGTIGNGEVDTVEPATCFGAGGVFFCSFIPLIKAQLVSMKHNKKRKLDFM